MEGRAKGKRTEEEGATTSQSLSYEIHILRRFRREGEAKAH